MQQSYKQNFLIGNISFQLESVEDQKLARILQHQRIHQLSLEERTLASLPGHGRPKTPSREGRPQTPGRDMRPQTPSNRPHTPSSLGAARPHTPSARGERPHTPGNRPQTPSARDGMVARPHTPGRDNRPQTPQQKESPRPG